MLKRLLTYLLVAALAAVSAEAGINNFGAGNTLLHCSKTGSTLSNFVFSEETGTTDGGGGGGTPACTAFSRHSDIVQVAPYGSAISSGQAFGGISTNYAFLVRDHGARIRQDGPITNLRFYVDSLSNISSVRMGLCRYNGATYTLADITPNLISSLAAGQFNTITLGTPLSSLQGDYYCGFVGVSGGTGGNVFEMASVSYAYVYYRIAGVSIGGTTAQPSTTVGSTFDWDTQLADMTYPPYTSYTLPIEFYGQAPNIVMIGDSLTASGVVGNSGNDRTHHSYIERYPDETEVSWRYDNIAQTWEYKYSTPLGLIYQDMGIGGQTSPMLTARFSADVIALHPSVVTIMDGYNDIANGSVTEAQYIANITAMVESALANNIEPWVLQIPPSTNMTTAQSRIRDQWNLDLQTIVAAHPGSKYVENNTYMGQYRPGGDSGNLWDYKPDAVSPIDHIHFSAQGCTYLSQALSAQTCTAH